MENAPPLGDVSPIFRAAPRDQRASPSCPGAGAPPRSSTAAPPNLPGLDSPGEKPTLGSHRFHLLTMLKLLAGRLFCTLCSSGLCYQHQTTQKTHSTSSIVEGNVLVFRQQWRSRLSSLYQLWAMSDFEKLSSESDPLLEGTHLNNKMKPTHGPKFGMCSIHACRDCSTRVGSSLEMERWPIQTHIMS